MYIYLHSNLYIYIYTHIYIFTYIYLHIYIYIHIHIYIYIYINNTHIYKIHVLFNVFLFSFQGYFQKENVCTQRDLCWFSVLQTYVILCLLSSFFLPRKLIFHENVLHLQAVLNAHVFICICIYICKYIYIYMFSFTPLMYLFFCRLVMHGDDVLNFHMERCAQLSHTDAYTCG